MRPVQLERELVIERTVARKLWLPYRGLGSVWFGRGLVIPPPRLVQLLKLAQCRLLGHRWGQWRVETADWFKYVDRPEDGATRTCGCGTVERARHPGALAA